MCIYYIIIVLNIFLRLLSYIVFFVIIIIHFVVYILMYVYIRCVLSILSPLLLILALPTYEGSKSLVSTLF